MFQVNCHRQGAETIVLKATATKYVVHDAYAYQTCKLTHCGRVTQICVFNTVKLGTSASSP